MSFLLLFACVNATVPAPQSGAGSPADSGSGDPVGSWYVVWDRSATGWSPPKFNGVLVLERDSMALTFQESSSAFEVDAIHIDGATFDIVARSAATVPPEVLEARGEATGPHPVEIRGFVDGDRLLGYMRSGDLAGKHVPWAPLQGKRAKPSSAKTMP